MNRGDKWQKKEITYKNNPKTTEKLKGPHNKRDSLVSEISDGGIDGRSRRRPRIMSLNWVMKEETASRRRDPDNVVNYVSVMMNWPIRRQRNKRGMN